MSATPQPHRLRHIVSATALSSGEQLAMCGPVNDRLAAA